MPRAKLDHLITLCGCVDICVVSLSEILRLSLLAGMCSGSTSINISGESRNLTTATNTKGARGMFLSGDLNMHRTEKNTNLGSAKRNGYDCVQYKSLLTIL